MLLIHLLVRPYASTLHNIFDGIILQLIIISVLPIVEFADTRNYNETFVIVIIYLLIILPLINFIAIKVWINKKNIQSAIAYFRIKCSHKYMYSPLPTDDPEEINDEVTVIVDDSMRRKTILVDV